MMDGCAKLFRCLLQIKHSHSVKAKKLANQMCSDMSIDLFVRKKYTCISVFEEIDTFFKSKIGSLD